MAFFYCLNAAEKRSERWKEKCQHLILFSRSSWCGIVRALMLLHVHSENSHKSKCYRFVTFSFHALVSLISPFWFHATFILLRPFLSTKQTNKQRQKGREPKRTVSTWLSLVLYARRQKKTQQIFSHFCLSLKSFTHTNSQTHCNLSKNSATLSRIRFYGHYYCLLHFKRLGAHRLK